MNGFDGREARACLLLLGLAFVSPAYSAQPSADPNSAPALVTTNYVTVTNVVIVTNYIVSTNLVLTTNSAATAAARSAEWEPSLADGADWIQLNTGEWLKGDLKAMQERKLDFDSEKLKLLSFDWKDIRRVLSGRWNNLLFEGKKSASGPFKVTPNEVIMEGPTPEIYPRSQLLSITPGGKQERDLWSGKIAAGLTVRSGNTRSVDYNAQVGLQRRTPTTRFMLDYIGNISSVDDIDSANNHRVNTEFDFWLTSRFYLITPLAEYFRDPFQNINHRAYVGVGVGYDLINKPDLEWNVSTGPAYQHTWFTSVEPGESAENNSAAMIFSTRFDWEISRRFELILEYRGQYTSREVGETTHHAVATLEIDLTRRFELDLSFIWDRISDPKTGADGVQPKPDDFRMVLSLGVRF